MGAIRIWNVAHRQPKHIMKVGSHGVHYMCKIKDEPNKLLLSFMNGAIAIFNVAKRSVEF